jgi:hypothetical protein
VLLKVLIPLPFCFFLEDQAGDPQTRRISTPLACALQARQAHAPKAHYFTSAKGLHPLYTCHRKALNLPKRHTQTGLDAKELASEQQRLQFYCSRMGDLFFFPFFKGLAAWFTV